MAYVTVLSAVSQLVALLVNKVKRIWKEEVTKLIYCFGICLEGLPVSLQRFKPIALRIQVLEYKRWYSGLLNRVA